MTTTEPTEAVVVREQTDALPLVTGTATPEVHATTPAQAKVEAIANLTFKAYERASTLTITPDEATALAADFPDEAFKQGAGGNPELIYIEHAYLRDRLSKVFGPGQWAIIPRNRWAEDFKTKNGDEASRVYVEAMLVIRGCFVSEAVGDMVYYKNNATQNYGDAVEGAKTACLRRCAKELGIGLQAWKKDFCEGWKKRKWATVAKPAPAAAPAKPAKPDPELEKRIVEKTRLRMVEVLTEHKLQDAAKAMFEQLGWLLPTEDLNDLPDARVPRSKADMDTLLQAVNRFIESGDMPQTPTKAPADDQVPGAEVPAKGHPNKVIGNEPWWDTIVVVPHKGQSKSEYVKNPDTIKSLYLAAKMGDEEASKRLFGLAHYFDPKPWTGKDGKERPPSDADKHFRAALNSFLSWHDHPAKQNEDVTP